MYNKTLLCFPGQPVNNKEMSMLNDDLEYLPNTSSSEDVLGVKAKLNQLLTL